MRRNAVRIAVLALTGVVLSTSRASAQGFGVYEHDACAMGRAGTGVAAPCNASAMFYNPAGIVRSGGTKWQVSLGGTMIRPSFTFTDSATGVATAGPVNSIPVPHLYISRQFANGWAGGIGVFAPYGLISEWPVTFSGRFLGYRSELKTIYIQPTVARQINNWLQIGAGFDYIRTIVNLKQRVDLSSQATTIPGVTFAGLGTPVGTDFADANIKGGSWSAGAHIGVIVKPMNHVSLGARYLFRSTGDVQGDAFFTPVSTGITLAAGNPFGVPAGTPLDSVVAAQFRTGGALVKQHASTRVPLPDQIVVGIAVNLTSQLTLLADYQWVHWDRFSKLQLTFANLGTRTLWEDYKNTNGYRLGAQFDVTPKLSLRGGVLKHDGAAPDNTVTPLLPEGARVEQTFGASLQISTHGRLEAAYQHINQQDRRGRVVDAPRFGGAALNTGLYSGGANLFGVSLVWGF